MATLQINPNDYGFTSIDALARAVGTMQGEAGGHGVLGKARILDNAVTRANSSAFSGYLGSRGYRSDPVAAQFMAPNQYSTWLNTPATAGAYRTANRFYDMVNQLGRDPSSIESISSGDRRELMENLSAIYGVMGGEALLRGVNGDAIYYSTGGLSQARMNEHNGYGLGTARTYGKFDGHYFYGGGDAATARTNDAVRNFPISERLAQLGQTVLPGYSNPISFVPEGGPPRRPEELSGDNTISGLLGGSLDGLYNSVAGGLRGAGDAILGGFQSLTGRLPTADEFKGRLNDVASGARSVFDQLGDIGSSAEAKSFGQATGLDPSQYVVNDIYRLGLGRDVDQGSLGQQMDVLRTQGGQSLYNQVANSQEGRTYALNNYYGSVFGHEADTPGMNYWLGQLAAGKTMPAVQAEILASPEAQALAPSVREQLASLITPSFMTPTLGFTGSQVNPIGPGSTQYPLGPGSTTYPLGPGSTTYPVGPDGYETSPVGPGPTQYPVGPGATTSPVGPGGFEASPVGPGPTQHPVGPDGYEVGTVPPPALSPEIRNYYETYLHRAPDAQGAIEYQGQLDRGVSPSIIEAQILSAPEAVQALTPEEMASRTSAYQAKYGLLPEEAKTLAPLASDFARVLGRPADSKTIQWWDQQIDAGTPFAGLEAQILTAPETKAVGAPALTQAVQDFQTQYALKPEEVTALGPLASEFGRVLDRPADIPTMQAWDAQLDAGATMPQLQAQFLTAPEVQARTGGRGDAFDSFQAQYGRSASDYLAGLNNGFGFSGANVSGGVGPGSWHGTFDGNAYLAANPDVAAAKMNPLDHYTRFGYGEGRAIDAAGDRLPQGFNSTAYLAANPDVARTGMGALDHWLQFGAHEGRQMPTGDNSFGFSGANVSQGLGPIGNGAFSGKFNAADYLAANQDVARSGMNAEDHYLRYGFGEGRAIDTAGHRLGQNFDGTAYLAANKDVALAGMDPLRHYIESGASEGRAMPTGSNPYSFSNFNASQGAGPTGNGGFGISGITSSAPGGMGSAPSSSAPLPAFGSNLNVSGGVGNGSFGFSGIMDGGGQSQGQIGWESAAPNALPGSGGGSGSAFAYKDKDGNDQIATFDPQKSENAYLAGQVAQNQQQIEAGRASVANNPNLWNFGATNLLNSVAASNYQPGPIYSTATGATAALPSPVGPAFNSPLPVMNQGLGVNPYGGFGLISTF